VGDLQLPFWIYDLCARCRTVGVLPSTSTSSATPTTSTTSTTTNDFVWLWPGHSFKSALCWCHVAPKNHLALVQTTTVEAKAARFKCLRNNYWFGTQFVQHSFREIAKTKATERTPKTEAKQKGGIHRARGAGFAYLRVYKYIGYGMFTQIIRAF